MTVLGRGSENDFNREDKLGDLFFLFFIYQVINKSLKESKKMIIITNNPKVKEEVQVREVLFKDTTYIGILEASRDLIHEGYELLSHPLYGSVKPNETPYRTVILKKGNRLDINSLTLIEEAIITASKFQNNKKTPKWTESVQDDFRVIDYDIFYNTIQRMQYE